MVAEKLGIPLETFDITDMVEPLFRRDPQISNIRKGISWPGRG
jgi:hypothetical protein